VFRSTYTRTLHGMRGGLVGWGIGVAATIGMMAAVWPSFADVDVAALLNQYPEALRQAFNVADMGTGSGFLNGELFSIILPAIFAIYGIGRGARTIAGEEQAGLLEIIATMPRSRTRLLLEKAAAMATGVAVLGVVLFASMVLGSALADMGIGAADAARASIAMTLLGIEFGAIAFAVGAVSGRRSLAVAVSGGLAVAAYLLYLAGQLLESVKPYLWLSPVHQAISGGPIGPTLPAITLALPAVTLITVACSVPVYERRDLTT